MVVLDGSWDRIGKGEDADAPRRLYYVAMTRARQTLALARFPGAHRLQYVLSDIPSTLLRQEPMAVPPPDRCWLLLSISFMTVSGDSVRMKPLVPKPFCSDLLLGRGGPAVLAPASVLAG